MPKIPIAPAAITPTPYNGYALTKIRRAAGDETERFACVLCHDGIPIAYVTNGGESGAHRIQPIDEDGWEAIEAFRAYATVWNAQSDLAGFGDADQLINRLLMVDRLNRARLLPFTLAGEDFWVSGEHDAFRGASAEQTLEALRSPEFAHRRPCVWSKAVGEFVPVV